jgi:hypothetical protein
VTSEHSKIDKLGAIIQNLTPTQSETVHELLVDHTADGVQVLLSGGLQLCVTLPLECG